MLLIQLIDFFPRFWLRNEKSISSYFTCYSRLINGTTTSVGGVSRRHWLLVNVVNLISGSNFLRWSIREACVWVAVISSSEGCHGIRQGYRRSKVDSYHALLRSPETEDCVSVNYYTSSREKNGGIFFRVRWPCRYNTLSYSSNIALFKWKMMDYYHEIFKRLAGIRYTCFICIAASIQNWAVNQKKKRNF